MESWLQNDGFVQRLAELSQSQYTFHKELIDILRKDFLEHKAAEIMQNIFLGTLELKIFSNFDPRGDETLAALQDRLAKEYIPHNMPDSSDLSPLLEIFQDNTVDQSMTAYGYLWSEYLSANLYQTFQTEDWSDRERLKRIGRSTRNLFLRDSNLTFTDIEGLCGRKPTFQALKDLYCY